MSSQHHPTDRPIFSGLACICAAIAGAGGATHAVLIQTAYPVRPGTFNLLAAIIAVFGVGFFIQLAVERVLARQDRLEAKIDGRRGRRGPQRLGHSAAASESVGIVRPDGTDAEVTSLPAPDVLRAARNLAGKVIASERQRVEDNSEDTSSLGK